MDDFLPLVENDDEFRFLQQLRREFHQYPEVGYTEFWTTSKICEFLHDCGYELRYGADLYNESARHAITRIVDERIRHEEIGADGSAENAVSAVKLARKLLGL